MAQQILIVEDEIFVAMELEYLLTKQGFDVVGIAPDSSTALSYAEEGVDIAFVDLNLRDGQTGPEIGRTLGKAGTAVIFTTANPALLGDGVEGTLGVLSKPWTEACIKAALEFALRPFEVKAPRELYVFANS
jgi:DNA-binding response OmpR family regulator